MPRKDVTPRDGPPPLGVARAASRHAAPAPAAGDWVPQAMARFEAPLLRFAARIVGSHDRARDVVQETFLRLCREDPARVHDHLAEWLYRVCRHRAIDILRKERRMHTYETGTLAQGATDIGGPSAARAADSRPLRALEAQEEHAAVAACIRQLPPRDQELLHLKFQAGFRYRQISQVTGLSEGNIGYLLHMALRKLRLALQTAETTAARGERTTA